MCGIIGTLGFSFRESWVEENLELLRRRGPDSVSSFEIDNFCTLGASRLAMVDALSRSNQPMRYASTSLVFNGEIYNYNTIKNELKKDYDFITKSDTEVLLAILQTNSIYLLNKINGMFAFAFYDGEHSTITLGRDSLGKKPLYYLIDNGNLYFSSIQQPLRPLSQEDNECALYEYLNLGFVIDPDTWDNRITSLKPGEIVTFALDEKIKKVELVKSINLNIEEKDKIELSPLALRNKVIESVETRIVGHESNVGLSLSGGIDSTIISICLAELGVRANAYSVSWSDSDKARYNFDAEAARKIAKVFKHNFESVDAFDSRYLESKIHEYIQVMEEPNSNSTGLSMLDLYAKASQDGIRLVLTGDGADEIFGGYERYRVLGSPLRQEMSSIRNHLLMRNNEALEKAKFKNSNFEFWSYWHRNFSHNEIIEILGSNINIEPLLNKLNVKYNALPWFFKDSKLKQIQFLDQKIWLSMESNRRLDRVSMHYSVEARSPFQDVFFQYQFLKMNAKELKRNIGKKDLVEAFPELRSLPILKRKTGFISPLGHWLRQNSRFAQDKLIKLNTLYNIKSKYDSIEKSILYKGDFVQLRKVWSLLVLSCYLEKHY